MSRTEATLRLTSRLIARRDALRRVLAEEMSHLRGASEVVGSVDPIDEAVASANDEVCSRLAELESRELAEIEEALRRIAAGSYGRCESCGGRIPSARLNALPCATRCIACQRRDEGRARSEPHPVDVEDWSGIDAGWSLGDDDPMVDRDEELVLAGSASRLEERIGPSVVMLSR